MRVLITAGGTVEKIDDVREIRNTSTGRLAQLIADSIDESVQIDYVYNKKALVPQRHVYLHPIESVRDLDRVMAELLQTHQYDAVIFAMAVSDYMIQSVTSYEHLAQKLDKDRILDSLYEFDEDFNRDEKIRSKTENLAVLMTKAPKVIQRVKDFQKDTQLVGFKLLSGVSKDELIDAGMKLMKDSHADYVLANDLIHINQDEHVGHLIQANGNYDTYDTKQEIAMAIVERLRLR